MKNYEPKSFTGGKVGNPAWKKGVSGNPSGHPHSWPWPKITDDKMREFQEQAQKNGWMDPVSFQHMVMSDPTIDISVRLQAANNISRFFHPPHGNKPVRPDPLFFTDPITFPNPTPTTIAQVRANISYLAQLKNEGKLDTDRADSLIADQQIIHDSLVAECKLAATQGDTGDLTIRIEGGLPPLPGTNITMPALGEDPYALLTDPDAGLKTVDGASHPAKGDGHERSATNDADHSATNDADPCAPTPEQTSTPTTFTVSPDGTVTPPAQGSSPVTPTPSLGNPTSPQPEITECTCTDYCLNRSNPGCKLNRGSSRPR